MMEIQHTSGAPSPLGLSKTKAGWNLALFSAHAKDVSVSLFHPKMNTPFLTIPMNQSADIWHIALANVPSDALYAFQCDGEWNEGNGNLFNGKKFLADPFAKILDANRSWNPPESHPPILARFATPPPFDWEQTARPNIPKEELIIYEMHVRGFTVHPSSQVTKRGTYRGIIEKIPYLKKLGINAIELMPIFEFDETRARKPPNYWGYNPLSFFAPKQSYSSDCPITEFKELVRELHKANIEVILDVVYNHTGEEEDLSYAVSWRGIDNRTYYLVDRTGKYKNFSGCGNTLNANHPAVRHLILESMRYWVEEMHVDGFRFDLASILTRGPDSHPMEHPPLILDISKDPAFSNTKLIAEAWDAAGLYQLGTFPKWGNWSEWNGRYRDVVRRFIKGTNGKSGIFATVLSGSDMLYAHSHTPTSSINFITAHDGYSLRDLVSYQEKHNEANGEQNNDGSNTNDSWNCGCEGPTNSPEIIALRERQMRNFLIALFVSQGIPLLLMGDEYGHTRHGNNNPYVQDNEINWFLWDELPSPIFDFVSALITFRKNHPQLHLNRFLTEKDVQWHGRSPNQPDFSYNSRLVAFSNGPLYIAFNSSNEPAQITLPSPHKLIVNTSDPWTHHFLKPGPLLPTTITLAPYSALIATQ